MIQQIRLVVLIPHTITKGSKRPEKVDWERKVRSTCFARFLPLPSQGCWVKGIGIGRLASTPTRLPFLEQSLQSIMKPQSKAHRLFCAGCVIHSHKHAVELVKWKMCILRKQRLELWELFPCPEDPGWAPKMIANNVGFVISEEDLTPGPGTRLDHSRVFV